MYFLDALIFSFIIVCFFGWFVTTYIGSVMIHVFDRLVFGDDFIVCAPFRCMFLRWSDLFSRVILYIMRFVHALVEEQMS